jgi:hypothetical protein
MMLFRPLPPPEDLSHLPKTALELQMFVREAFAVERGERPDTPRGFRKDLLDARLALCDMGRFDVYQHEQDRHGFLRQGLPLPAHRL